MHRAQEPILVIRFYLPDLDVFKRGLEQVRIGICAGRCFSVVESKTGLEEIRL